MHMQKFSLLICLLTLLLCACEVKPTAVTTDAQPTEATSTATETTEVTTPQEPEIPRYTVAMNSEAVSMFLCQMQLKAEKGESYPSIYEIVAEENNNFVLRISCTPDGNTAENTVTQVEYYGEIYPIDMRTLGGYVVSVFCLPDLLIFGESGASVPGSTYYFFYNGGMCGYNGKELLLDGVNDEAVSALRAPAVKFTLQDGVLHYAKYYHYAIQQADAMVLRFADTPDELYSEEGTITFSGGKLTLTHEKTATIEDFAARYYDKYNVTNFADLMQAMKNR